MNIMILHHFSDYWEHSLNNLGTSYETELEKVIDYLEHEDIHKVILPLCERDQLEFCHNELLEVCNEKGIDLEVYDYFYGWLKEHDNNGENYTEENENITWCQGTRPHHTDNDVVEIADWMHELQDNNIIISGAFDGECVADLEAALDALDINYKREEGLIVGSNYEYEFRGLRKSELISNLNDKICSVLEELEDEITEKISELEEEFNVEIFELEELHKYNPNFVMKIEEKLNIFYNEIEDELEEYDIWSSPSIGLINVISDNIFENREESFQFDEIPDEYLENLLKKDLLLIENKFNNIKGDIETEELNILSSHDFQKVYEQLKNIFHELKDNFDENKIREIDIDDYTNIKIIAQIWNDCILNNVDLKQSSESKNDFIKDFLNKKINKTSENTNTLKIRFNKS